MSRIICQSKPIDEQYFIEVEVNNEIWFVQPIIYFFRKAKPSHWFRNTMYESFPVHLNMDLRNLTIRLCDNPYNVRVTEDEVLSLMQNGISKGIYIPINADSRIVKIAFLIDSWLKLTEPNSESHYITVLPSQIDYVIRHQKIDSKGQIILSK